MTRYLALLLALVVSAPLVAQRRLPPEPELPRTAAARRALAVRSIDGVVKVNRDHYKATPMAILLAGGMQGQSPVVTVLGVGRLVLDVDVPTVAECSAQGYRVYVGPALTARRVNLNATCSGSERPFQVSAPIADFRDLLTSSPQTFAATAFVQADDGVQESERATAPFVLRLGAPPVGPMFSGTAIRPPQ